MNIFKFSSIYIFVFFATFALTLTQVLSFTFPPDCCTKSYYVTGEDGVNILWMKEEI